MRHSSVTINRSRDLIGVGDKQERSNCHHDWQYAVNLPHRQRSSYRSQVERTCGKITPMDMGEILARITERRERLKLSEQALAVQSGMSKDGIRNWRRRHEAGDENAGANVSSISKVATTLGVSELWLLHGIGEASHPTISIAGKVGAGAQVPVFDAYEKGGGPQVECPPGLSPHGIVAVEVEGDSMEPVYSAGDLLFYSRNGHDSVPSDVIGYRCVCEDVDGMGWVKQVKAGDEPGLFHLISLNPGANTMWNVRLNWAARVRLHWPAELAKKR
ncbi:XRE family transcriptional regulator [Phaeobacter inhibens]|uniref:XRE family transcriptional regulator n=1 Tax=Phaeobacter inhibens TaxID=221822 RepID=UPI0021A961C1|nr:S24 family peptidase [Phaeobacter inhibens]